MIPAHELALISQEDIEQQGRPQLPANGVLAVAQEVTDFESLLNLLEEDFDPPAGLIELTHAAGGPFQMIGDEKRAISPACRWAQRAGARVSSW
jgi:hypothetical protein